MFESEKKLNLTDLVDVNFLQEFQDAFAKTMDVASLTIDDNGAVTKPSNFTEFCIKFTRGTQEGSRRCNECDMKWGRLASAKGEPVIYDCHVGFTDFAVPIIVKGQHMGTIYGGQVLTKAPDEEHFRRIAREIGVNEDEYINALRKVKIVSPEYVKEAAHLLSIVANAISEIGHKNYELQNKNKEEKLYREIVETIRSSLDIDETKSQIVNIIGKTLSADRCFIVEYDNVNDKYLIVKDEYLSSDEIVSIKGIDVNIEIPAFAEAVKNGNPLIINNKEIFLKTDNDNFDLELEAIKKYNVNSAFGFPLSHAGEFLGVLGIHYVREQHNINNDEINLLTMITDQIAIAIYQSRLYLKSKQLIEKESVMRRITEKIRGAFDLDQIKYEIVSQVGAYLKADRVFFSDYDPDTEGYSISIAGEYRSSDKIISMHGVNFVSIPGFREVILDDHLNGLDIIFNDVDIFIEETGSKLSEMANFLKNNGFMSIAAVNINYGDIYLGDLVISYEEKRTFLPDDLDFIKTIANQSGVAIYQANSYKKEKQAAEREKLYRKITETIRSSLDIEKTLFFICKETAKLFNVQRTAITSFHNPENYGDFNLRKEYISNTGFKGIEQINEYYKASAYWGNNLIKSSEVLAFDNIHESNAPDDFKNIYKEMGVKSVIGTAIKKGEDVWGILVLSEYNNYRHWTDEEKTLLKTIADQVYIAIHQAELYEDLKKTTANQNAILNNMPFMAWLKDVHSRLLAVNQPFADMCRETVENVVGKTDFDFFPKEHAQTYVQEDRQVIDFKQTLSSEDIIVGPEGEKWYETFKSPVFDDKGNVIGTVGLARDITERREAEIELLNRQKKILMAAERERIIAKVLSDAISTLDMNQIKQIVTDIGIMTKADRCYFVEVDLDNMKGKPIEANSEYLASPDLKSAVGYEFPKEDVKMFVEIYLESKDLVIFDYENIVLQQKEEYKGIIRYINQFGLKSGIGIPFYYREKLTAVLVIEYREKVLPSEDELNFLRILGNQIGVAFSQIQLYRNTKNTAERETLLREVIETIRSSIDLDETLTVICDEVARIFRVQRATIVDFYDKNDLFRWKIRREFKSREDITGLEDIDYDRRAGAYNGQVIMQEGKTLIIDNIEECDAPDYYIEAYKKLGVKSILSVPIKSGDDKFGIIFLSSIYEYKHWSIEEVKLLESIAAQIYVAIKQAELFENQKNTAERELLLRKAIEASKNQIEGLLDSIPYMAWIKDMEGKYLATNKGYTDFLHKNTNEIIGNTDYEIWPAENAKTYRLNDDLVRKERKSICIEEQLFSGTDSIWAETCKAPILDKEGNVIGIAGIARDITERRRELIELTESRNFVMEANKRETLLRQIIEVLRSSLDLNEIKRIFVKEVGLYFKADRVAFADYDYEKENYFTVEGNEYRSSDDVKTFVGYDFTATPGFIDAIRQLHLSGKDIIFSDLDKYLEENNLKESPVGDFYRDMGFGASMAINIYHRDDFYGNLVITFEEKREITEEEVKIVKALANQAGIAIYQSTLYQNTKKLAGRENLLRRVVETLRGCLDMDEVKRNITKLVCKEFKADRCNFRTYDVLNKKFSDIEHEYIDSDEFKKFSNVGPDEAGLKYLLKMFKERNLRFYPVVTTKEDVENTPLEAFFRENGIKAIYSIVTEMNETEISGFVLHYLKKDPKLSEEYKKLLETIAYQIEIASNQIKLYNTLKNKAENESMLRQIFEVIRGSLDINVTKEQIVNIVGKTLNVDICAISEYDRSICKQFIFEDRYFSFDNISEYKNINIDEILPKLSKEIKEGKTVLINNKETFINFEVQDFREEQQIIEKSGITSALVVPLFYLNELLGSFTICYVKKEHIITEDEINFMNILAEQIAIALHQSNLYKITQTQAEKEIVLREIITFIRSSLDINEIKSRFVSTISRYMKAERGFIVEYDQDKKEFLEVDKDSEYLAEPETESMTGFKWTTPLAQTYLELLIEKKEFNISDVDKFIAENGYEGSTLDVLFRQHCHIKSAFNVLITYGDNILGFFCMDYFKNQYNITSEDEIFIKTLVDQAGIALHQANLYKKTLVQSEREKVSKNIIEILRSTIEKDKIKHLFVYNIGKYFKADRVFFSDYDSENKMYLPVEADSEYLSSSSVKSFVGYDWSDDLFKDYIQPLLEKRELRIECWPDYIKDNAKTQNFISRFEDWNVKSSYNIPVLYQQRIMGYFCIEFTQDSCHKLSSVDISSIRSMCSQAGIALYHSEIYIKAQESSRSKGEFIANISNELAVPLNNLIDFSEILSKSEFDCDKQIEYLNNINRNSKQLLDLKNDISIINIIESENFKLDYERVDFGNLIMNVVNSIKSSEVNRGVNIYTDITNEKIYVDQKMFSQILYNLLNIAIKLSSNRVNMTVKSQLEFDKIITSIEISGSGMSIDIQNLIFEKFKQIDSSYPRRPQKVGLELSTASRLVGFHKGTISVESTDDRGTKLWVVIPNIKK